MISPTAAIPQASSFRLHRARVPASLLSPLPTGIVIDREGLAEVDIEIGDGRIAAIRLTGTESGLPSYDLDGGQIWPGFVDLHTHLDKGHIWPRAVNETGTHLAAATSVGIDRQKHWSAGDLRARFEFALRCSYAHGTTAIRTHLDSYDIEQAETAWAVFRELRQEWRGRVVIQAVSLAALDTYGGPNGARLADLVARSEGVLGGISRLRQPLGLSGIDETEYCFDRLFVLAAERGLDIDLHVDETLDPSAQSLRQVAAAALRHRFKGKVVCGHCCSLSAQAEDVAAETIRLCAEAGIAVVALPLANIYLQGRGENSTPRWRGVTTVHELRAHGVSVAVASDNCRDPFFGFGDHDLLEVFREFVRIAHADMPYADWPGAVTSVPAMLMGLAGQGRISVGAIADLVLFRGRGMSELLSRPQTDRIVLRAGREIDTRLPDYRELDDLFA